MSSISDTVERKFIESFDVDEWEIDTDSGWHNISSIHKTIKYNVWKIIVEVWSELLCADTHIIYLKNLDEIFVKDCVIGDEIITRSGIQKIIHIETPNCPPENMYDITVESNDHRFWAGEYLSHNSVTTVAFILWYVLFAQDKTVAL